jgi:hypothetical protein
MSALTAASTYRENVGSLTLHIINFTSVTAGDTYASGLGTGVVSAWANMTQATGTTTGVSGAGVNNSSGTFTFANDLAAVPMTLFVVSKS